MGAAALSDAAMVQAAGGQQLSAAAFAFAPRFALTAASATATPAGIAPGAPTSSGVQRPAVASVSLWRCGAVVFLTTSAAAVASVPNRAARRRQRGMRRTAGRVPRRFFNFGGPEEEVDPNDPGRVKVCGEYQNSSGSFVAGHKSEFGWAVVSEHSASEQDGYWPGGAAEGEVKQVWRELRLASGGSDTPPDVNDGTGQTVVKVSLREGEVPVQVPYCMPLAYAKTMAALAFSGQHLQGALPLDDVPLQRALVVGLGGGSLPVWLNHTFPEGKISVDALEIDPAVVEAATKEMGFPAAAVRPAADAAAAADDVVAGAGGQSLRVYSFAGEEFLEALGKKGDKDYKYDMVFIDAFDKAGRVPTVLVDPEGPFLKALEGLLAPKATVTLNLLVGMTGRGSSGGPGEIMSMVYAVNGASCNDGAGEVFSVRTPINESSGNQVYCFLREGRTSGREEPLKEAMKQSAEAVGEGFPADVVGSKLRFDLARRVVFAYEDWVPPATPPRPLGAPEPEPEKKEESGGFGFFGF